MKKTGRALGGITVTLLSLALLLAVSCSGAAEVPAPTVPPQSPAPPSTSPAILGINANLLIGSGVPGYDVYVSINQPGIALSPMWFGDIIFYLDVDVPSTPGEPATTEEGTYRVTQFENFITWEDLSPGSHSFAAQLVTQDLTPLDPPVDAAIRIDVPSEETFDQPLIQSLSVQMLCRPGYYPPDADERPPGAVACADIVLSSNLRNFRLVSDKIGQAPVPGEGHFIYYFNVDPPTAPGEPALTEEGTYAVTADSVISWRAVLPGEYDVWVQLVNNDNTPLDPPVVSGGTIIVPPDADRYG